jgi:hypothetical protein
MRRAAQWTLILLLVPAVTTRPDEPPRPPSFARELPTIEAGTPILAFNGKNLTGFYVYTRDHGYDDPNRIVTVIDGLIRISGQELGGLVTCGNFGDYHLVAEWKWGEKTWPPREANARDSGILLHCVGPDGAAGSGWMESIECQIIEGGCGDFILVPGRSKPRLTCETRVGPDRQLYFEKGGNPVARDSGRYNWWGRDPGWKDALGFRDRWGIEKPPGEWNRMEVVCDGDSITNILNGHVVNVGTKSSLTEGKILFQSEGAEILFRTIEVRPLRKPNPRG